MTHHWVNMVYDPVGTGMLIIPAHKIIDALGNPVPASGGVQQAETDQPFVIDSPDAK
jgi:hypothetical protein